jgi:hypothetical protein
VPRDTTPTLAEITGSKNRGLRLKALARYFTPTQIAARNYVGAGVGSIGCAKWRTPIKRRSRRFEIANIKAS